MEEEKIQINWIPLNDYYEKWEFLGRDEAYRVAEQIALIDYLMDIKERLPNYILIQKCHEKVILISLGALFEYGLKKAAQRKIPKEKERAPLMSTFNIEKEERQLDDEGMEKTINRLALAGLLTEEWKIFLHKIRVLRDEVHMERSRDEKIQKWLKETEILGIRNKIDDFCGLVKSIINDG
jgi:hypothetical protein